MSPLERWAAGVGVRVRPACAQDSAAICVLARASFPLPAWLFTFSENRRHHTPEFLSAYPEDMVVTVAWRHSALCACLYGERRSNGEFYVRELSAQPRDPSDKVPGCGMMLLGNALEGCMTAGITLSSVNVLCEHREPAPEHPQWRDPVPYYESLGYRISDVPGIIAGGGAWDPEDTWMTGSALEIHARIVSRLCPL